MSAYRQHRKECHTCPTHTEIMAGVHKETPWAEMPCAKCPLARNAKDIGPRSFRGRAGQTRLSMDFDTIEIVEAERDLHPIPPPERRQEDFTSRLCESHRQLISDLLHSPSPEAMTARLVEAQDRGETVALSMLLLQCSQPGLWAIFQRLAGAEPGEIAEKMGVSGPCSHARARLALERMPPAVARLLHGLTIRRHSIAGVGA